MSINTYPDSLYYMMKTTSSTLQAHVRVVFHNGSATSNNAIYQDPNPTDASNSVVGTDGTINKNKEVAVALDDYASTSWTQRRIPFTYSTTNHNDPTYVLATFSTSGTAGAGNVGDAAYFDDVILIYNTRLASLKINGSNGSNIPGFNPDVTTYNLCVSQLPIGDDVIAVPQSAHATATVTHPATTEQPYTTIKVTHKNQENDDQVSKVYTINYSIKPTITLNSSNNTYTACEGETITVTVSSNVNCTYSWSNGLGSGATVHPTQSGNYSVTATNNGCSATATAYVTVNPLPIITINGSANATASVCSGAAATLTAAGGETTSYSWSTGASQVSTINVNTQGSYSVTGSNSYGCSATASASVSVFDAPTVTITSSGDFCQGSEATLTASGANTYVWGGSGSGQSNPLTITTSGTYTVIGTDEHNCTGNASLQVTFKPTPNITISGPDQLCDGASGVLTASAQTGTTFNWTNGTPGSSTLNISGAGTYTVTANLNGCTATGQKVVAEAQSPAAPTVSNVSRCGNGQVTLEVSNPVADLTYYWYANAEIQSESATGTTFSPTLSEGDSRTYYVSAKNATGCFSNRVPVTATANTLPTMPTLNNSSVCGAQTIDLTTQGSTLTWYSDQNGNNVIANPQAVSVSAPSGTFYAAVIDGNNCRSQLSPMTVTVRTIPDAPMASITSPSTSPICTNSSVNVTMTATSTGYPVIWYNSDMDSLKQSSNYTVNNLNSGTDLTYYAKAVNNGCKSEPTAVHVVIYSQPTMPTLSNTSVCGAQTIDLTAQGNTLTWYSDQNGNNVITNPQAVSVSAPSNTFYAAVIDDNNCRSQLSSMTVTVNTIYAGITDMQSACGSYSWAGNTYTQSGEYTEKLTSSKGCDSTVTLILTISNEYNISIDTNVCGSFVWAGSTYTTSGTDTKVFQSSTGCDSTVTYHFTILKNTTDTVRLTLCSNELPYQFFGRTLNEGGTYEHHMPNVAGCDSTITLILDVKPQPAMATVVSRTNCGAGIITLNSNYGQNGTTCRWYTTMADETPFQEGTSYSQNYTEGISTYFVSSYNSNTGCESGRVAVTATIYPVPANPQVTPGAHCGAGEVTMSATPGENATTCRWYNNTTANANIEETGVTYSTYVSGTRNFYVESYNTTTNCKSTRVAVTATINPVPAAPQVTNLNITSCGTLNTDLANNVSGASLYRWYDENETLLAESAHYNTSVEETTTFLVSSYIAETHCESDTRSFSITINPNYEPQSIYDTICQYSPYDKYDIHQTYDQVDDYVYIINQKSSTHCDSVVTLYLHVKPVANHSFSITACDSYDWDNSHYTQSNDYVKTYSAANGCDSIVTLHLTINQSNTGDTTAQACDSFDWYEYTGITTSGDYTHTFTNAAGCDSVVTLHLSVYPSYNQTIQVTACEQYTWNGQTYYESGDYTETFTSIHNCDSIVTLQLTINNPSYLELNDQVCVNSRYTEYGFDTLFTTSGTYTLIHNDYNQYNCDSTTTLTLLVTPTYNTPIQKMICENSSYDFHGQILDQEGVYYARLSSVYGCDSLVTLSLTIGSEFRDTIHAHVCAGGSYHENGFDIDNATVSLFDSLQLTAANECDSISVLHLIVHQPDTFDIYETLCQGDHYTQYGFDLIADEVGEHTSQRQTVTPFNCDSTIILHMTVNPTSATELYDSVCMESPYHQYGFDTTIATAGNHTLMLHLKNSYDCDSTVTMHLTVHPKIVNEIYDEGCLSYTWNDSSYTETGNYTRTFSSIYGCDSTVTLHLTIHNTIYTTVDTVVCDSLEWDGTVYTASDVYQKTFTSQNDCDSIVTLNLTVNHSSTYSFSETVCDSYTWGDTTYTASGIYTKTFLNSDDCDSVVTLNLTVNQTTYAEEDATACDSLVWHGRTLTATDDYYDTLVNVAGCDSIEILHLTIHHSSHVNLPMSVCDSLVWDNDVFYESDVITKTFSNIAGCDSVVTLNLTVNHSVIADTTVDICDVETPFVWGNNYLDTTDVYSFHYETSNGCDSLIRLHLNVHPTYIRDTAVTICQGALPYEFCTGHTYSTGGVDTVRLETVNGCDSIWILDLHVTPNYEHTEAVTVCSNTLPVHYGDSILWDSGSYDIIETGEDNCRTITHLTLTVNVAYHNFDTMTVCQEALPIIYGDSSLQAEGNHDIYFTGVNHCDSIVTLTLNVIPTAQGIDTMYVCTNDFPTTYNGQTFNTAGIYPVIIEREGFCDSVVTLNLIEAERFVFTDTVEVCDYTLPYSWRDSTYTQTGVYYDSLKTQHGCDSIFVLNLTVNETQVERSTFVFCASDPVEWRGRTLTQSDIYYDTVYNECRVIYVADVTVNPVYNIDTTISICDAETPFYWDENNSYSETGNYPIHYTTEYGCDSIIILHLNVHPSAHLTENISVCDYNLPYIWHGDSLTESGTYYDTIPTVYGCDSTFTLNFTVNPSQHSIEVLSVCSGALPYSWRGQSITESGTYYALVPNMYDCEDTYELQLTVNPSDTTALYDTICEGNQYTLYGFDTLAAQQGTIYLQQTLTNIYNCDSTVNLVLTVLPNSFTENFGITCENTPYEWRGYILNTTGDYYDTTLTPTGCDSIFVLHLTVNPAYHIYVSDTAVRENTYTYGDFVITPADSGVFTYDIQGYTIANCDSVIHLTLYVEYNTGIEDPVMLPEFKFFPNPTNAVLNIKGEQMRQVHIYDLNGKLVRKSDSDSPESTNIDVTGFASGHYVVKVLLENGQSVTRKIIVDRR